MISIFKTLFNVLLLTLIYIIIFHYKYDLKKVKIKNKIKNNRIYVNIVKKYKELIEEVFQRQILLSHQKHITVSNILIFSTAFFVVTFIVFFKIIKLYSTAIILSTFVYLLPYIVLKQIIDKEKKKILYMLPAYIVNLKNHIQQDNNIIIAMRNVTCIEPLNKYIQRFNMQIERGINIKTALNGLKSQVGIKKFDDLLIAIETCYFNGGRFENILNKYIAIISKENIQREKIKERAYSSVVILIIIMIINIYLVYTFIFSNDEYANIIRNTLIGNIILNINTLSYILIGFIVSKIYRTGEKI